MIDRDARDGPGEDLAFFGRVTASATHQINNVLSILIELHGLIEDLSAPARAKPPLSPEKLADILGRCQKQVARGVVYVERLNAFAHTVDEPVASVQVAEVVETVAGLADRPAQLRRATLASEIAEGLEPMQTRPFRLVRAVYTAVELALAGAGRGTEIILRADRGADGVVIAVQSSGPVAPEDETAAGSAGLRDLVEELSGRVEVEPQGQGIVYRLVFAEDTAAAPRR